MHINKAQLYGNLTRDPEVKTLPSNQTVASFAIATSRSFKDKSGTQKEETEYHNIVAFGKQAEIIAQYMKKGSPIYVEGRLQTRSWDKEGVKQYRTEIIVDNFQFGVTASGRTMDKNSSVENHHGHLADAETLSAAIGEDINPEDIPF